MTNPGELPAQPLEKYREMVIDLLCRHVAVDNLTLEEFERRVDLAHRAGSHAEFDAILRDLPVIGAESYPTTAGAPAAPRPAPVRGQAPLHVEHRQSQVLAAVMSGTTRTGSWIPAEKSTLFSMMGGIEIIVPPGLTVDCDGVGIMGGFDHQSPALGLDSNAPVLRIRGVALMGGVELRVQLPGETAAEARRRIRAELREARRAKRRIARHSHGRGGF